MALPTTGKITTKPYRCTHCENVSQESTNHYGKIYSRCTACSWKRPGQATVKECLEPVPEGMGVPADWKIVRLGDIAEIR